MRCGWLVILLFVAKLAAAANFSVTPVRIYMKPQDRAVAVTIQNDGSTPVVLQADIYSWSQKADGTDDLVLTEDLILSPPIIKLGANAKQVVRLARIKPADASRQLTYRMVLREVPEAAPQKENIQVAFALALSMPVFITPAPARREMSCEGRKTDAATLQVSCGNKGSAYAQVREVTVRRGDLVLGRVEGGFYILPGARRVIPVKATSSLPSGKLQVAVTYDDGRVETFEVEAG